MSLEIFGKSITGRRNSNQDSIYFDFKNEAFIMAVADGVGGNVGGDIASGLTVSVCKTEFQKFAKNPSVDLLKRTISEIYNISCFEIQKMITHDDTLKKMGTTLTIVVGFDDKYVVGNIGDSRTYLIRDEKLIQLTKDHSYIEEYRSNFPDKPLDSYIKSQLGHIITKSLSAELDKIDIFPLVEDYYKLEKKDGLLLCSDGLQPDKLKGDKDKFIEFLQESPSIEKFVEDVIEFAYNDNSRDNISTIVAIKNKVFK